MSEKPCQINASRVANCSINVSRWRIRNSPAADNATGSRSITRLRSKTTSGRAIASVPHFLRHDFGRGFHFYRMIEQGPLIVSGVSQIRRNDEVDLAFRQKQLHELRVILVLGRDVRGNVTDARIHETQILRIGHKNVDVLAEPMAISQHKHGAATERSEPIGSTVFGDFIGERKRVAKQALPRTGR